MLILTIAGAIASECETPLSRQSLGALLADAEVADRALAIDEVLSKTAMVRDGLPCVGFRLEAAELATFYRLRGWALFTNRDPDAEGWLATAWGVQPAHAYSPPLPPPMQTAWERAAEAWASAGTVPLEAPRTGSLVVNGRADAAPVGLPWTLQHLGPDGDVLATWFVGASDPVPAYERPEAPPEPEPAPTQVAPAELPAPAPVRVARKGSAAPAATLLGVGAVGIGTGVAMWGGSNQSYARHCVGDICPAGFFEEQVRPQRTLGMGTAAVGGAVFAAGVAWLTARSRGDH